MPRIKKNHPPLPTKFSCPNASNYLPPAFGFRLGDYVYSKVVDKYGWVCGSDTIDDTCHNSFLNPRNQLIVMLEGSPYSSSVNGSNTYTGIHTSWRKIENTRL